MCSLFSKSLDKSVVFPFPDGDKMRMDEFGSMTFMIVVCSMMVCGGMGFVYNADGCLPCACVGDEETFRLVCPPGTRVYPSNLEVEVKQKLIKIELYDTLITILPCISEGDYSSLEVFSEVNSLRSLCKYVVYWSKVMVEVDFKTSCSDNGEDVCMSTSVSNIYTSEISVVNTWSESVSTLNDESVTSSVTDDNNNESDSSAGSSVTTLLSEETEWTKTTQLSTWADESYYTTSSSCGNGTIDNGDQENVMGTFVMVVVGSLIGCVGILSSLFVVIRLIVMRKKRNENKVGDIGEFELSVEELVDDDYDEILFTIPRCEQESSV